MSAAMSILSSANDKPKTRKNDGRRAAANSCLCGCGASKFLRRTDSASEMSVQVYGCNHVAIEVGDVAAAVAFYVDVFALVKPDEGEGDAFFKLGEHQFLAMFENKGARRENGHGHFGIMVRDESQIAEVRDKLVNKYRLKLIPGFRCDFRDPWGNRIQVVDLHDESLIWLLPHREVQKAGVKFGE
jgi:catechol 2,3-dioxygenase-like lactoylglutathione lyase family enzyme